MNVIQMTTVEAEEEAASILVEAAQERRDAAIDDLLNSGIYNLSDAINELGDAQDELYTALEAWCIPYDKLHA